MNDNFVQVFWVSGAFSYMDVREAFGSVGSTMIVVRFNVNSWRCYTRANNGWRCSSRNGLPR